MFGLELVTSEGRYIIGRAATQQEALRMAFEQADLLTEAVTGKKFQDMPEDTVLRIVELHQLRFHLEPDWYSILAEGDRQSLLKSASRLAQKWARRWGGEARPIQDGWAVVQGGEVTASWAVLPA